jgi:hypothetical protein
VAAVAISAWLGTRLGNAGAPADERTLVATVASAGALDTGTPDETVHQLTQTLNLICAGRDPLPQAVQSLQDQGLDAATARRILDATHTLLDCDPTTATAP